MVEFTPTSSNKEKLAEMRMRGLSERFDQNIDSNDRENIFSFIRRREWAGTESRLVDWSRLSQQSHSAQLSHTAITQPWQTLSSITSNNMPGSTSLHTRESEIFELQFASKE